MNRLTLARARQSRLAALRPPAPAVIAPATRSRSSSGRLGRALARALVPWPAPAAGRAWVSAAAGLGALGWIVGGPTMAALVVTAVTAFPAAALWAFRDRADEQLAAALGPALESIARSIRSGASLPQAVGEAAANAPPVLARDLQTLGASVGDATGFVAAVERWAAARDVAGVRLTAAALALAAEAGGPPARPLEGVATSLQERTAVRKDVHALASQARMSAMVIVIAPVAFAIMAAGVDASSARFLLTTGAGQVCLALGVALDLAGALWMHRITKAAES